MKSHIRLSALAAVLASAAATAASPAANTGAAAQRITVKPTASMGVAQFTVRVPVRLNKIGATWKRGAVQCTYTAVNVQYIRNPFHPTDPPQEFRTALAAGQVDKIFNLSADGSYNGTLSVAWGWSGDQAGNKYRTQEYSCRLLLTNQTSGDNGWVTADSAGIDRDPAAAYRIVAEGEIPQ